MATISTFIDHKVAQEVTPGRVARISEVLDFGPNGPLGSTGGVSGDTIQALKIKGGTHVFKSGSRIIAPEGGVATADLGDGVDPDGYSAATNLNAAAETIDQPIPGTDAYATGKSYPSDDTIDLLLNNNLANAKVEVWAEVGATYNQ